MRLNPKTIAGLDTGRLGLWNPANLMTFARLVIGIGAMLAFEFHWLSPSISILLLAIAAASDLDGYLARSINCASDFGRFIDPLVDKLFLALVGTWSIFQVGSLWPIMLALIFMHFLIGVYTLRTKSISQIRATNFGRRAMALTLIVVVFALYAHNVAPENEVLRVVSGVCLGAATVAEIINLHQIHVLTKRVGETGGAPYF